MRNFFITRPDDWHTHFRDGDFLSPMIHATTQHFARALAMPNLQPPLTTVSSLLDYRERIMATLNHSFDFTPYVTLYLNESLTTQELQLAKQSPYILGAKLYPAGATTNSELGVQSIRNLYPLFDAMQTLDLVLQIHGEVTTGDIFEREALFIEEALLPLMQNFPKLRIVLEHISSQVAVECVEQSPETLAATITPQHLFYNRNQLLSQGIRPHYYCLPILKHERDQRALQKAAVSGNPKFFAGTDSAPHLRRHKENTCGCAGIFSAPYALPIYAEVFDGLEKLSRLDAFTSHFGAQFYHLPINQGRLELIQQPHTIPEVLHYDFGEIIPIGAGTQLQWSVSEHE